MRRIVFARQFVVPKQILPRHHRKVVNVLATLLVFAVGCVGARVGAETPGDVATILFGFWEGELFQHEVTLAITSVKKDVSGWTVKAGWLGGPANSPRST